MARGTGIPSSRVASALKVPGAAASLPVSPTLASTCGGKTAEEPVALATGALRMARPLLWCRSGGSSWGTETC